MSPGARNLAGGYDAQQAERDAFAARIEALEEAIERIQGEANTVGGDWRETASMIDSICIAAMAGAA